MTELIFSAIFFMIFGYIFGMLFKRFNPFLMVIGFVLLIPLAPIFIEFDNDFYTVCLIIGGLLNFKQPVSSTVNYVKGLFNSLTLGRQNMGYSHNFDSQKQKAEDELYRQKSEIEEELRQQRARAEQDINRQRREAEESIKREKEEFQKNKRSSSSNHSNTSNLNPSVFADACEILWMHQDKTLQEYKKAYKKLMTVYHPDNLYGLSETRKEQANQESKRLNVAMRTIEKKLKN